MTEHQLLEIHRVAREEMGKSFDPQHDFSHVERVRKNALKIAKILRLEDELDGNLLQAACLLHDLAYSEYRPGLKTWLLEGYLSKGVIERALNRVEINDEDKNTLIKAIARHPYSFPLKRLNRNRDVYTKVLQDADTLDSFSEERIENLRELSKKSIAHKVFFILVDFVFKYGRRNVEKFLNFPELAENFYVQGN